MTSDSVSRYEPGAKPWRPDWPVEVDLHLHTTASDGTLSPTQLIELVLKTTLRVVAITDHDSTEGVDEAIAASAGSELTVIPGIEFGSEIGDSEVHLIGLFIDHNSPALQAALERFREQRIEAAQEMVRKLNSMGVDVTWERVSELAGGSVGRPHIARAMLEKGFISSIPEAFDRYIGNDGPARVPRPKFVPVEALEIVHAAGGIGVVAHPRTVSHLEDVLPPLVEAGLAGIEVFAEKYGEEHQKRYRDLADLFSLIQSGGTDYHAFGSDNEVTPGMSGPPPDTARRLFDAALKRHGGRPGFTPARPL
ncbi:MAG: PHP domain-containing protein [Chloroflexi bacterium]|nr:PHP domain-containing protein [Chloroflexota bacterium]